MEGPISKLLDNTEMLDVIPHLQVLTRLSPEDKKIIVEKLKSLKKLSILPDGTNDGPALKMANVGFLMGIAFL